MEVPDQVDSQPQTPRRALLDLIDVGLTAVHGRAGVARTLAARPMSGPVRLIALGKAAQAMAEGAIERLGDDLVGGLVVSKAGHLRPERLIDDGLMPIVGGHPLPDAGSLIAGRALIAELTQHRQPTLFLLSGGASSLVEDPVGGLNLADLRRANDWLLASGWSIGDINLVRKALSRIKGGGLLKWLCGRPVRALAISDVPGDDPSVIGSGLLVPDPTLASRVRALAPPGWLAAWVERGLAERADDPGPGVDLEWIATLDQAKAAVAAAARAQGWPVYRQDVFIAGDAEGQGAALGARLRDGPPGLHLWGGETTVRLPNEPGRGGRNQQLALSAARAIAGCADCWFASIGTDGSDGP
ncbi:DUF4147 domain-containing protein, partial [Thioalkalicoccus limnaeus]